MLLKSKDMSVGPSVRAIVEANIKYYRDKLKTEPDVSRRRTIVALLAEEEAKLPKVMRLSRRGE